MGREPSQRSILLVGMMGSGKSAVGRALASRLGWDLVDTDGEIERRAGVSIPEIFDRDGEAHFRRLEREILMGLPENRAVVALGGGAVTDEENRKILEAKGTRVWLEARPETLAVRVGRGDRRPLVRDYSGAGRVERLGELLGERREAYAQAQLRIATDERSISEVVDAILRELEVRGPAA